MKKVLGITFGGLQKKTLQLVLLILAVTVAAFMAVSVYQSRMLVRIVGETRSEQQEAISLASEETMNRMLEESLVRLTGMQARIANNDFSEVVSNIYTLHTIAQGLFEKRDSLEPLTVDLPDPALI